MNWKCAYCHNCFEFSSEKPVKFCPHCGKETNFQCNVQTDEAHSTMQKVCPVCSTEISSDEEQIVCPDCKMVYHQDCWADNNGCATYGCPSSGCLAPPPLAIHQDEAEVTSTQSALTANSDSTIKCPYCGTGLADGNQICWNCGKDISASASADFSNNASQAQADAPVQSAPEDCSFAKKVLAAAACAGFFFAATFIAIEVLGIEPDEISKSKSRYGLAIVSGCAGIWKFITGKK